MLPPAKKKLQEALRSLATQKPHTGMRVLTKKEDTAPYLHEWRDTWHGSTAAVVLPADTKDIAAIIKIARTHRAHIVPQSGNTGLVGGQIPFDADRAITVSLARMTRILHTDPENNSLACQAGCPLADIHAAAAAADRFFPLSLASEGTARIGGLLSTNAGGNGVLRYGTAGDLALGIEAVLADGSIWNGMRRLRKDNTGYDLKRLFIGAEGTLGIITAAVLRLFPRPRSRLSALAAVLSPEAALALLRQTEADAAGALEAFELIPRIALEMVRRHIPNARLPYPPDAPWHVLFTLASARDDRQTRADIERILETALAAERITDAAVAATAAQEDALWHLRHSISPAQKHEGGSVKHDISVPVSRIPDFLARALPAMEAAVPGIRPVPFGHMGDGNIHLNLSQPTHMTREEFAARAEPLHRLVYDLVAEMEGSISAEHGIGVAKIEENLRHKSAEEIALMRRLKHALDPHGIFNPGKLLP